MYDMFLYIYWYVILSYDTSLFFVCLPYGQNACNLLRSYQFVFFHMDLLCSYGNIHAWQRAFGRVSSFQVSLHWYCRFNIDISFASEHTYGVCFSIQNFLVWYIKTARVSCVLWSNTKYTSGVKIGSTNAQEKCVGGRNECVGGGDRNVNGFLSRYCVCYLRGR